MKRKFFLSILAVVPAALMPLAGAGQAAPASGTAPAERGEPSYKYEFFAGYGYTSLNQVNQSRSGLQGYSVSITRDWGKYFGITADGGSYTIATSSANPGKPSVSMVLAGPVIHAQLYERVGMLLHALMGGAHTGGESANPNISMAGGFGGGLEYSLNPHFSLRATGDDIASAFVQDPNHLGYSPHLHWNARASFGVVYKF